jgi:trigger factor
VLAFVLMKSEITARGDADATVKITVDHTGLAPLVKKTFDRLRPRVKAAGFRPGKAPDHIVERELGSGAVQDEVLEEAVRHSYMHAVTEHDLKVVASPEVSVTKFVPYSELEFTAKVALLPQVQLPDYSSIKAKPVAVDVTDAEVDRVVEDLRRRFAKRTPADRPAAMGDEVRLDFSGTIDGQAVDGASAKDYLLQLGSNVMVPGFEKQLVGLDKGESKQFEVKFPADYRSAELKDKTVRFDVTVNDIIALDIPAADEKFVTEVSQHATLDQLKTDIKERILAEKSGESRQAYEAAVLDEILSQAKFALPEPLLHRQMASLKAEMGERLAAEGLDLAKYQQIQNMSDEELERQIKPEAERRVKLSIILGEISKAENVTVTPDEVNAEHQRLKQSYSDPKVQKELDLPRIKDEIYNHILASRTIAKIIEKVEQAR